MTLLENNNKQYLINCNKRISIDLINLKIRLNLVSLTCHNRHSGTPLKLLPFNPKTQIIDHPLSVTVQFNVFRV